MQSNRCGHFLLEAEVIYVPGAPVVLRIPIRRCLLAEQMIGRLAETEKGREIGRKLSMETETLSVNRMDTDEAAEARIRAAFGPDLEPIHQTECLRQRCMESCTPNFKILLEQFGFHEEARREDGAGCLEMSSTGDDLP